MSHPAVVAHTSHPALDRQRVWLERCQAEHAEAANYNTRGAWQASLTAAKARYSASLTSHLLRSHGGDMPAEAWPLSTDLAAHHDALHAVAS
jgi:hypothetical protein